MTGSMTRLVLKDNITTGGELAPGQTLWLGSFTMTARSAIKPTMTSGAIENPLRIDPIVSGTVDLSMKAPMSVSKPADLG